MAEGVGAGVEPLGTVDPQRENLKTRNPGRKGMQ